MPGEGVGAHLVVPMLPDDRVEGLLYVGNRTGRPFTDEHQRILTSLAGHASVAIRNARLYQDAERQRREAEILAALTGTIGSTLSLDAVLQRVAEGARELCQGDLAEIALREPAADVMLLRYWAGLTAVTDRTQRVEPGKGMGGQVILTGQPMRTDDYEHDRRFTKDYLRENRLEGIVTELVVPIVQRAGVEGLLYVSRRTPRPFTARDEAILVRLAEHASMAITNARLYGVSERRRQEATSLAELGRLVSRSLDVAEVGQRIVDSLQPLLRGIVVTLYRIDPGSGDLVALSTSGEVDSDWHPGVALPRGTGISGRAVAERRPVVSLDVLTDPAIEIPPRLRARVERLGYRTALAVPLLIQDRVIGALGVGREAGRGFDEDETRLVQAFADQAAVALENARLFEEQTRLLQQTRRQHDEALALELVGRQITSSLEREEVFQRIVDRSRLLCGCDVAYLATYDPATETAPIVAVAGARSELLLSVTMSRRRGLGGRVLETGEPWTTVDYLNDPVIPQPFVEVAKAVGTVAEAVVPLRLRGVTVGLLGVINRTPMRFTPKDIGLLSKFAVQAAIALENSRLYAERARVEVELKVRARQQAVIAELGQRALAEADVQAVMEEAIGLVARTLDVEYCQVLELLPDGTALVLRAGVGWKEGLVGRATVAAGADSQAGYALMRGEPVVVEDVASERRFAGTPLLDDHHVVSGVSVVIRGATRPFGVLGAHTQYRREFTRDDLNFLQSVANVLATAIGRRLAEDALRESEERFRAAFDQSRIGRALQSLDGRFLRVNRALCEIVGYSEEELLSLDWQAITHAEDLEVGRERSGRLLADGRQGYVTEKRYRHKQGGIVWVALSVSLVRDANGRPLHCVSESEDITPRKQAEEALRQHTERLRMLHEIDRAIIGAQSPQAIAQAAARRIRRLVPCRRASVVLFDFDADQTVVLAVDVPGETRVPAGATFPIAPAFGDLDDFRTGKIRIVEDVLSPSAPSLFGPLEEDGLRSFVSVPLLSRNSLVGTLNLWRDAPGSFPPDQIQIARQVADSLAVAIQDSQLFAQVLAGRERLQALSRRLVEVQEAERRHIARELHDEIGQVLTGLKLTLEMSERGSGQSAARHREGARTLVNDLLSRVRELSLDLRPAMLDDLGLLPALLWHFERYTSQTGIRVRFEHAGIEQRFVPEVETAAYRIAQEALTNVARHAGVSSVEVRIWTDSEALCVQVEDRGRGFDPGAQAGASSGLAGMRERAVLLGGDLTVDSAPAAGTRVTAAIPVDHPLERRARAR